MIAEYLDISGRPAASPVDNHDRIRNRTRLPAGAGFIGPGSPSPSSPERISGLSSHGMAQGLGLAQSMRLFELASGFDFDTALTIEDKRRDYGEPRYLSLGCIGSRLYALVFTPRGSVVRVISLGKANSREETKYAEQKTKPRIG